MNLTRCSRILAAAIVLLAGCSRVKKSVRLSRLGDQYFDAGNYEAAAITYTNSLQLDLENARAIGRLGIIYFDDGEVSKSGPFLAAARQMEPTDLQLRMVCGLYELTSSHYPNAAAEANYILDHNPAYPDAMLLLAESAVSNKEMTAAEKRLRALPAGTLASADGCVALGTLDIRRGRVDRAEALFQQAVAKDPNSSSAWTALAVVAWSKHDLAGAEKAYAKAAELAPLRSSKRLQYAQFEIRQGNLPLAHRILSEITAKAPDYLPGLMLVAQLEESERNFAGSAALAEQIMGRDPDYPGAIMLAGRVALASGNVAKAVTMLEAGAFNHPHQPLILYELAQAYAAEHKLDEAVARLTDAVTVAPDFPDAALMLAQVRMQLGDPATAIVTLRRFIARHPDNVTMLYALGSAYSQQSNLDEALAVYQRIAKANPRDARPVLLAGEVFARAGQRDEARQCFEQAQRMLPDAVAPLTELVTLDAVEHNFSEADRLIARQIAAHPKEGDLYMLKGRLLAAKGEIQPAEAALRTAITLQPDLAEAYYLLAGLYFQHHQDAQALIDLKAVAAKDPHDLKAPMLVGAILQAENQYGPAREAYKSVLAINPDFTPALNNLAYLDSTVLSDLDGGFRAAQHARELRPNDPHIADTLGWILLKRHDYKWALSLLQESASDPAASPEVHFHLGAILYLLGRDGAARDELKHAVAPPADFPEIGQARQDLQVLAIKATEASAAQRQHLEAWLKTRPDDPEILARLSALDESEGNVAQATTEAHAALQSSPQNLAAMLQLARLMGANGDAAKAMELAKAARDLAPEDPDVEHVLGRLAFDSGDHRWAYSLLESAHVLEPANPDVSFDYARAAYSQGDVAGAEAAFREAANGGHDATEARRWLGLVLAFEHPAPSADTTSTPTSDAPGLLAAAAARQAEGDYAQAKTLYSQALQKFPEFRPAQRELAILASKSTEIDPRDLSWVDAAREAYPTDPAVAKAAAIVAYRHRDFSRASILLQQLKEGGSADGEMLFYLGMAQFQLHSTMARQNLQAALALGLTNALAEQAKHTLATATK